ncbi:MULTISPECIES: DUF434 domain-containing protein [unclassified Sedimentibacter]|uniref:DUF434 domain-containing protein n=1 Tax=unclassified Sedimentibacter TaxID=2649220 RepID=UPI0027DFBB97|nr:DUF434 domain-containing protein [Sedimentibacter sp. MB35-C1]WMJ76053.1 DUF434 domain-containing protein [Sedimentibacter sp. MB35-C1]
MTSKIKRRGFDPEDVKSFSEENVEKLRTAQEEVQWLLERGYKIKPVIGLIGNHYLLTARARTALQRTTSTRAQYEMRKSSMLPWRQARDGCLFIDGFNLIITLEVALSGSVVLLGRDGVLRDLAGLRGTYKVIDKTEKALELIGRELNELEVPEVKFYLDSPVSNSGRLKSRIAECSESWNMPVDIELIPNVDAVLSKMGRIVTGDSILLDECKSWFNLSKKIVDDYIRDAWIVNLE